MSRPLLFLLLVSAVLAACGPGQAPSPDSTLSQTPSAVPATASSPDETPPEDSDGQPDSSVHIWSLGGNGWALRLGERMLIFDYVEGFDPNPPAPGEPRNLERGYIDPEDLRPFDVYVFVTHAHQDHFDPVILQWEDQIDSITYFFGWEAGDNPEHHYLIGPRAHTRAGGVDVHTINSHHDGIPEVAYLVDVGGFIIYHNGDYRAAYVDDFDFLQTITDHIDVAFVIGWPFVDHQHFQQALLLADLFHPTYMFAICRPGDEHRSREFAELVAEHGVEATVLYAENRSDDFILSTSVGE